MGLRESLEGLTDVLGDPPGSADGLQHDADREDSGILGNRVLPRSSLSAVGSRTSGLCRSVNPRARIRGCLPGWKANRILKHIGARLCWRVSVAELARVAGLS